MNGKDTNMLVSFALGDAKVPNANGFASQWNIGFKFLKILFSYSVLFNSQRNFSLLMERTII